MSFSPPLRNTNPLAELEQHISIICRGITRCIDGTPYANAQKAHIYVRIAAAMMQASQCEMADAIIEVQAYANSLAPIQTTAPNNPKEPK